VHSNLRLDPRLEQRLYYYVAMIAFIIKFFILISCSNIRLQLRCWANFSLSVMLLVE